ncbi:MAG: hypothetical protein WC796_05645 [Candidatus Pacearchaeota archaeon]|jgi:hypothetical protein
MTDELSTLIASHKVECRGIDRDGQPAFGEGKPCTAIINVYDSGSTVVLCRYFDPANTSCNPQLRKGSQREDLGDCIYEVSN